MDVNAIQKEVREFVFENFIVDTKAVQQQHGFEQFLGGSAQLVQAMGTDPDIALGVMRTTSLVCQRCFLDARAAVLWEASGQQEEQRG